MPRYEWVKPGIIPVVSTVLAVIVMFALGAWQLHRLEWKQAIISKLEAAQQAAPVLLESMDTASLSQHEFTKVDLVGEFDLTRPLFVAARYFRGELGYHVLLPFNLRNSDKFVLVNTGWIPEPLKKDWMPKGLPESRVLFSGFLRIAGRRNPFTPENNPAGNFWFWYDLPAMEKATGHPLLPVVIDRLDPQAGSHSPKVSYPVGFDEAIKLRNDHLQYAVTWFGIGLAALVIFVIAHMRRKNAPLAS